MYIYIYIYLSGVAQRACVRVYARVLVPPNLHIHTYIYIFTQTVSMLDNIEL